ncbi:MAG TPA: hypothetical protein DCY64_22700 [Hydrogenophaga sp.]|uniref:hypothetical protein n=1 Tax=Hydrogenophaga sp. TaxID=1904254 RepID=UPI0008BBF3CA|nr:hypothetical protein [Hydrogenophaga sp.]OGA78795.1 MAG: hypothetical protein A2X73_07535 [Burkholderiales bacterium GWE1_65_30]OGA89366.1 MAG: hypothetical protein A2X72_16695 [Burkholderiales bacterium GWF1_66_17]HAX23082.1 hypothetical protein [Hydrogenophaga sp.]HBU17054.1 hypothetical protein [Hydrogenophaga sp.]
MELNIERIDSGPACMDATATQEPSSYADMLAGFNRAAMACDANALAPWAPLVIDNERRQQLGMRWDEKNLPQRQQTLTEVMTEALDYTNGPVMAEAMQLLLNVAFGADLVNAPSQARGLVERMGRCFAFHNSEVA